MKRAELLRRAAQIKKDSESIDEPGYNSGLAKRAAKRMARVDALPPEMRAVVYEYNLEVVQEFLNHGVSRPSAIKHLIDTVRAAPFGNGQPRFRLNSNSNAKRNPAAEAEEYWTAK
jgi:hypothetical protein